MYKREAEDTIISKFFTGKAILIFGARQVGKSTLLKQITSGFDDTDILWLNGDEPDVQALLDNISSDRLAAFVNNKKIIVIDEAQMIQNAGLLIKRMVDNLQNIQVIATGSSAFELADKTKEAITGRKWEYRLFPLSFNEIAGENNLLQELRLLPQRLIFGCYPDVVNHPGNEKELLNDLADSYLYKDILKLEDIKKSSVISKLVQLLSYQVGSEVSYTELANQLGITRPTVEKYIDILEKSFIVFSIGSYSGNLRNELKKGRKVYFYDNGIRNAVIRKYQALEWRQDTGPLWENFIISERKKMLSYNGFYGNSFFWRNRQQAEIDYIEETDGKIYAYEFKWNPQAKARFSKTFTDAYQPAETKIIHRDNYWEWLQQYPY